MPEPILRNALGLDLSKRFVTSNTVVASPALAAETIICQTAALDGSLSFAVGCIVQGWAAYTVGTSGTTVRFRIRQTNVSGTVVADTGAMSGSQHGAGILSADDVNGLDAAPAAGQVYVLTMQVANGAAASTVSGTFLTIIAV